MTAKGNERTDAAGARFLSAFALHRLVREPLELDRKRLSKGILTLHHDQACGVLFR